MMKPVIVGQTKDGHDISQRYEPPSELVGYPRGPP
jgi:hypothetical protein